MTAKAALLKLAARAEAEASVMPAPAGLTAEALLLIIDWICDAVAELPKDDCPECWGTGLRLAKTGRPVYLGLAIRRCEVCSDS